MEKITRNRPKGMTYNKKDKSVVLPTILPKIIDKNATALVTNYESTSIQSISNDDFTVLTIDVEWGPNSSNIEIPITIQVYFPHYNQGLIIINSDIVTNGTSQELDYYNNNKFIIYGYGFQLFEISFSDPLNSPLYAGLLFLQNKTNGQIPIAKTYRLVFYYSPKDIIYSLGPIVTKEAMLKGYTFYKHVNWIEQRKTLTGRVKIEESLFILYDLSGASNIKGLINLASEYGIKMDVKSSMDAYKANMLKAYLNPLKTVRKAYINYSINDVKVLSDIYLKRIDYLNHVILNVLHLDPAYQIGERIFPATVGKFVEMLLMNSIKNELGKHASPEAIIKTVYSMGYLNETTPNYQKELAKRKTLLGYTNNLPAQELEKHFNDRNYTYNAYNLGSISFLLHFSSPNFIKYAAYVSGGRTINERYKEMYFDRVFDLDIVSCYGSAINELVFPLGHPVIVNRHVNQEDFSLGEFLNLYGDQLDPGTYKIIVSGKIKQDLVYSRLLPNGLRGKKIAAAYRKPDKQGNFNLGEAVLLREEIINGSITSDILELINNVGTNNEKKAFRNLTVDSAIFYPKKYKCDSVKDWCEKTNSNANGTHYWWYGFELRNVTDLLLISRKQLKQEISIETDASKKTVLDSRQKAIKLINNTVYGVLASPHFKIGNCVTAENITSRGRAEVWKITKVIQGIQSITDGASFQPEKVLQLKSYSENATKVKKPGFALLTDIYKLKQSRFVEEVSLGNLNWPLIFNNKSFDVNVVAQLAYDHINDFWKPYGIHLKNKVEIKEVGIRSAHFLKSHYCIQAYDFESLEYSKMVYKLRGCHEFDRDTKKRHPYYKFFDEIINQTYNIPLDLSYVETELLRVAEWRSSVRKDRKLLLDRNYEPGSRIRQKTSYITFHEKQFPINTAAEYKSKQRAWESSKPSFHKKHQLSFITDMLNKMIDLFAPKI